MPTVLKYAEVPGQTFEAEVEDGTMLKMSRAKKK